MRIDRLHLDGFGRAENADILLGPGLTLVRGANGTGKTTVHQFLHAILFGFVKDHFPLVRGGRRGGLISGTLADGRRFEITRHGDPVTGAGQRLSVTVEGLPGGTDEQRLALVTGGVTKHVFESVFAFGQDELHDVGRLTKAEVADRIYGASIGVIGDVLKVERVIGGEMDALWKSRGALPAVNRRLVEIERLEGTLRARNLPKEYGDLRRRLETAGTGRAALDRRIAALDGRRRDLERLRDARAPWRKASEARAELATLPDEAPVTADDLAREAALGQAEFIATGAADVARATREALDTELAAASYRADVLDRAAEIDAAVTAAATWQSRRADIDERRRQRVAVRGSIDAVLAEAGWDEARLAAADPAQLRASVLAHARDDLDVPDRETAAPAERARTAAADLARVQGRVAALEASLASAPAVDTAAADELDRQARGLLDDLTRASLMRAAIEAANPAVIPAEPAATATVPATASASSASPASRSSIERRVVIGGGSAALALGAVLAIAVSPAIGILVVVLGLVAVVGAGFVVARRVRSAAVPAVPVVPATPSEHLMAGDLRALEVELAARWAGLGLTMPPRSDGVEPLRAEAARIRLAAESRRGLERDLTRLAADVAAAETGASAAADADRAAQAEVEAGQARWTAFLTGLGLPEALDRDGAMDLVARLATAHAGLEVFAALDHGLGVTDQERRTWAEGVARLAGDLGVETGEAEVVVERLRQELASARTAFRAREDLARRRDAAGTAERSTTEALASARAGQSAFLAGVGAIDAVMLAARHQRTLARSRAQATLRQAEEAFAALVPEDRRPAVEDALRTADPDELERQRADVTEEVRRLGEDRDALLAEEGSLGEQVRRLSQEADTSAVRQSLADERGALVEDARRWLVLRTATELLRTTRRSYEAKHRPAVLARAESLFVDWTAGEYTGFDRLSESGLDAVVGATDGKRVPLTGLSRGTAEQLYLAMRIALVEHLATQQEPLPLVMDDVLVNFDPDRAQRVARTIEEVAAGRQVIYLTCHRDVALRPHRTIELGRDVEVRAVVDA